MTFLEKTKERFDSVNSVLCIGLDPVIEKIPFKNKSNIEKTLVKFYYSILENFHASALAVKPNAAFYEQYGIDGVKALKKIIVKAKKLGLPVILDAKRGDIGETSKAYAKACFDELEADAVTLSPYLGEDSLSPFFEYKDKGFFILARTSNRGSSDFQLLKLHDERSLYEAVVDKISLWNKIYSSGIGAVLGATHIEELKNAAKIFSENNCPPLLIPGVGKQGGSLKEVIGVLKELSYPLSRVFINSSTKINYAYLDHPGKDYLEAAAIEVENMQIRNL
jgi:orotidine-5'-phosphate decarboxylase